MTRPKTLYVLCFCLLLALPVFALTFIDIAPFNSVETSARGINNGNDVVGDYATLADTNAFIEHGFLRKGGTLTLSMINVPNSFDTDANGINNLGTIVGTFAAKNLNGTRGLDHGYIKDKNGYHTLADPPANLDSPDFNAINDEGDIVGGVRDSTFVNHGFLLDDGVYTVLDCGGVFTDTEANGINGNEDIVGECFDSKLFESHAFLLHNGTYTVFDAPGAVDNNGNVLCDGTVAFGININGDIAGTYDDFNCKEHGFVVQDLLGTPKFRTVDHPGANVTDTKVAGINKSGTLVGTVSSDEDRGFKVP